MTNNPYVGWRGAETMVDTTANTIFYAWIWNDELETWVWETVTFNDLQAMHDDAKAAGEELRVSINGDIIDKVIAANRVEVNKPRY